MSDIMIVKPTTPATEMEVLWCFVTLCNVYNPVNIPLCELRIHKQLMLTQVAHDPASQWLHLWTVGEDDPETVTCQFGSMSRD